MSKKLGIDFILRQLTVLAPAGYSVGLHIRFAAPLILYQNYPQAWLDLYTEQAYVVRDPMVGWGFSTVGAIRWSEIPFPDTFGVFDQARKFGLNYGVAVAVGPMYSRTIAGIARSDREFTDAEMVEISRLIEILHEETEPPESLTPAQKQALQLIADGHRHAAAAAILGISESALKARLASVRIRLMARTTAEAVQRAKDYRLL